MIPLVQKHYSDYYTWSHQLGDCCIAHSDGAVSCMIEWSGIDTEMMTDHEKTIAYESLLTFYEQLDSDFVYEQHLWREWDDSVARRYLELNDSLTRGTDFIKYIREEHAQHLSLYGMTNSVALVITAVPDKTIFSALRVKKALSKQSLLADKLIAHANEIARYLSGGKVVPFARYRRRIVQSYDRDQYAQPGEISNNNPQIPLAEQIVSFVPQLKESYLVNQHSCCKVLFLYLYPDAYAGWIEQLSRVNVTAHIVQILHPMDTLKAMTDSERSSNFAEGTASKKGADMQQRQMRDMNDFRSFVADNNLRIIKNAYIVHLHGEHDDVEGIARSIEALVNKDGQVRSNDYMQLPYYRAAQPGQGYLSPMLRPDQHLQCAYMAPVQVYAKGDTQKPESLRLADNGQLIGINYTNQSLLHGLTTAKTGSGKDVEKILTIAETYGFGIDWYMAEIGGSYQWVVEALGGTYTQIDPRSTVINPLPEYKMADEKSDFPLDTILVGQTVQSLAFLLTDGNVRLNAHQRSAAQSAMQLLYAIPKADETAPNLADYLVSLEELDFEQAETNAAAQLMAANLHSFLDTSEGRIFTQPDNLILSDGIAGVDLKEVDKASPDLLKFYLVFITLRFNNKAFSQHRTTGILLNEMHKLVAAFPDVIGTLISELARMGRKDAAFIDIVTQGIKELDTIENEVLNSMQFKSLLYRPDEHKEIAERISLAAGPLKKWQDYKNPMGKPYRPGLRLVGDDCFDLFLSFPQALLDLSATDTSCRPTDLENKSEVSAQTRDPFERLKLFREIRNANP
jgi:hypothetical protein